MSEVSIPEEAIEAACNAYDAALLAKDRPVDPNEPCEDECEETTYHTVAAVATYVRSSGILRRRASVLRGEGDQADD